jgi:hypothetical protein
LSASADLRVHRDRAVNAVAVTFRAALYGLISHTLDPWRWPSSSWATSVWVFSETFDVEPESVLRVRYSRRVSGEPDRLSYEVVQAAPARAGTTRLLPSG